jgi:hypothetical protein
MKVNREQQDTAYKSNLISNTTKTTDGNTTATATSTPITVTQESAAAISDITEPTTETTTDMEEDDDGLADNMKNGIPSSIEKFTPNIHWSRDIPKNLPRRRYGLEIKITPEKIPATPDHIPTYHHIRIFKAISTAIMTAAPGTMICSINDDEDAIVNVEDIPLTQNSVDYYLESPIVNSKTYAYHARIYISCIKPLFVIMKNKPVMTWLQTHRIFWKKMIFPQHYRQR